MKTELLLNNDDETLFWRVGLPIPTELLTDPFMSSMIPKPTAWMSVNDKTVVLVEGCSVVNHSPPTLMMVASTWFRKTWQLL